MKKSKNPVINKLKMKFILIMMIIVVLFLGAIFTFQYLIQKKAMETENWSALSKAIEDFEFPFNMKPDEGERIERDRKEREIPFGQSKGMGRRVATIVVSVDSSGVITKVKNDIFYVSNSDITSLVKNYLSDEKEYQHLSDYDFICMKKELDNGEILISFADISNDIKALNHILINALKIGLVVFVVMLIVAVFLSKWVTYPVEKAWNDQKRFIADASHELKTPLTVIMSGTDMVRRSLKKDEEKNRRDLKRLDNIHFESERMKELIGELIEVARGDMDQKTVFEEVSLTEVAEDAVLSWEAIYFEDKKTLTASVEEGLLIKGDRTKLRRLMDILIDNAKKYSYEKSEVTLNLKKWKYKGIKEGILLSVTDHGAPLSEEEISHLFERFYRADKTREATNGYGLGLTIAEGIAKEHKARIWAESDGKDLNKFYVFFPV